MSEQDVLQHLLEIENEASALVLEAQKEADRRIAEQEKICREAYEKIYKTKLSELEVEFQDNIQKVKESYAESLSIYKKELENQPVQYLAFNQLMQQLLFGSN